MSSKESCKGLFALKKGDNSKTLTDTLTSFRPRSKRALNQLSSLSTSSILSRLLQPCTRAASALETCSQELTKAKLGDLNQHLLRHRRGLSKALASLHSSTALEIRWQLSCKLCKASRIPPQLRLECCSAKTRVCLRRGKSDARQHQLVILRRSKSMTLSFTPSKSLHTTTTTRRSPWSSSAESMTSFARFKEWNSTKILTKF